MDGYESLRQNVFPDDFVICADSGLYHARSAGIPPSLLVGDFDSYQEELPAGTEVIRLSAHKDETDTHFAVCEGLRRGFREFLLYGAFGSRPDHSFSNLCSLKHLTESGATGRIFTESGWITMLTGGSLTLARIPGTYVSVFPFGGNAEGVTLTGFVYGLHEVVLEMGNPIGVSNEFAEDTAVITVQRGTLMIMVTDHSL